MQAGGNSFGSRLPRSSLRRDLPRVFQDNPMTYCVALKLNEGVIFLADTLSSAGVDNTLRVRKQFTWSVPNERAIAMMTAGNLGLRKR